VRQLSRPLHYRLFGGLQSAEQALVQRLLSGAVPVALFMCLVVQGRVRSGCVRAWSVRLDATAYRVGESHVFSPHCL
jgi:hypothetical protein